MPSTDCLSFMTLVVEDLQLLSTRVRQTRSLQDAPPYAGLSDAACLAASAIGCRRFASTFRTFRTFTCGLPRPGYQTPSQACTRRVSHAKAPSTLLNIAEDLRSCSRPDEISVIMAVGDSITAGLFARPASDDSSVSKVPGDSNQHFFPGIKGFEEFRGVSFSTGGDEDAVTLANVSPGLSFEVATFSHVHDLSIATEYSTLQS